MRPQTVACPDQLKLLARHPLSLHDGGQSSAQCPPPLVLHSGLLGRDVHLHAKGSAKRVSDLDLLDGQAERVEVLDGGGEVGADKRSGVREKAVDAKRRLVRRRSEDWWQTSMTHDSWPLA